MQTRRSHYDVSNTVNVTESGAVAKEVCRLFRLCYGKSSCGLVLQAVDDLSRLYAGKYPGYGPCDTLYHDLQHVLDTTLAMARLMSGYELSHPQAKDKRLGSQRFILGIVCALFHDSGYIRSEQDTDVENGAQFTTSHIGRSRDFIERYLPSLGLDHEVETAAQLLHFTGYEADLNKLELPDPQYRLLGQLLGTADLIAQTSDRCYLEKCRDRLYPELVVAGIARQERSDGSVEVLYESAEDLLRKTPSYYDTHIRPRLEQHFKGVYRYSALCLGSRNYYMEAIQNNLSYLRRVLKQGGFDHLRRTPPWTRGLKTFPKVRVA